MLPDPNANTKCHQSHEDRKDVEEQQKPSISINRLIQGC